MFVVRFALESGVFNLKETKRRDLLNYIKSFQCNTFERVTDFSYDSVCKTLDEWLKNYYSYEKEQEVN